jgi:hypothetical protein
VLAALVGAGLLVLMLIVLVGWPLVKRQWRLMLANREWGKYKKVLVKVQQQEKTRLEDLHKANVAWAGFLELRLRKRQLMPPLMSLRALTPTELQPVLPALIGDQTAFSLRTQPFITLSQQEYDSAFLQAGISSTEARTALAEVVRMLDAFNKQTALV